MARSTPSLRADTCYVPNPNFNGIDHLTFTANDGEAYGNVATVRIRVESVDDPPVAQDQSVTLIENTQAVITLAASNPDSDPLDPYAVPIEYFIESPPTHGRLATIVPRPPFWSPLSTATAIYTPNTDFTGTDSFRYRVTDGTFVTFGTVTITVQPANHPPEAAGLSLLTEFEGPVAVTLSATDPDGDPLTYAVAASPTRGTLGGTCPMLVYTPEPGFSGLDSFTFTASDGDLTSVPATVTITVSPANAPPFAPDSLTAVPEGNHLVNLAWRDRSCRERGFKIERATDGLVFKQIATVAENVCTFKDTGVKPGKTYAYRVRAYNKNGASDYSNPATATTPR